MRILILSNTFWSVYNFRSSFVKEFIKNRNDVLVASLKDNSVKNIKKLGATTKEINIISKNTNPFKELKLLFDLNKIIKKYKPDVVINFTIKPIIYSSLLLRNSKIKVINTLDGFGLSLSKNFLFKKMIFILFKISQKNILTFFAVTKNDYNLIKEKKLVKKNKLKLINGTGVNIQHYKYSKPNKSKTTTFIFVGRFLILKGIKMFVKAAELINKEYKNVDFIAIGDCSNDKYSISKKDLKDWKKSNIVKFYKPISDVRKIIKNSDCIVLPTSYPEGLNRSLLEGISMGRSAITSKIGGSTQIIKNNFNGYITSIKNEYDLSKIMIKFHKLSYKKRLKFSRNGRKFVEKNFDEKKIIKKYLEEINNHD